MYRSYARDLVARGGAFLLFLSGGDPGGRAEGCAGGRAAARLSGRCRAFAPADAARRVGEGERAAVRFAVTAGREIKFDDFVRGELTFSTDVIGDPIIIRSDGRPAYNFAVVIDDALWRSRT